jgi:uncharacterized protein YdhG (YjbR/CyaY superfamily)
LPSPLRPARHEAEHAGVQTVQPKRWTLEALRRTILEIVPDAEQVISYNVPAFRVDG